MIVLIGKSASGKSTIEKRLCEELNLNKIVSYTTRPKRQNESEAIDYYFICADEFESKLVNSEFAEYTLFNSWFYGTDVADCTDTKICVLNRDGLEQLKNNKKLNITSFYINTDDSLRKYRLFRRGDSLEEIQRRFITDEHDFKGVEVLVDFIVENNVDLESCIKEIISKIEHKENFRIPNNSLKEDV